MWKIITVVIGFVPQIIDSIARARRAKREQETRLKTDAKKQKNEPKKIEENPYKETP